MAQNTHKLLLPNRVLYLVFKNFHSETFEYPPLNTFFFSSDKVAIVNKPVFKPGKLILVYCPGVTLTV
jgi:hypothetical protein